MSFKTRKIRHKPRLHPLKKTKQFLAGVAAFFKGVPSEKRKIGLGIALGVLAVFVVFKAMVGVYGAIRDFNPKDVVFALGTELQKDENGYTNIILLGDGGHFRDGADLIDTIMVASIDYEKKAISMFSIPRDYYVGKNWQGTRINEIYRNYKDLPPEVEETDEEALGLYRDVVGEIVGLDIPYYARVDFNAFVEIVDAIGGITVDVENTIDDPYYPNETDNGYQRFYIAAGEQEMDGETALKFARSRKTTSDFDRAHRQQQIIEAVYAKAMSDSTLRSPSTIKDVYNSVNDNINTNLTLQEMITLAGFARDLDRSRIIQKVINDDPGQEGGFLYTPERRFYDGQFVLVPFGDNLDLIHRFADLIFHNREMYFNPAKIGIYNTTKEAGIARNTAYFLNRFGFDIVDIDNEFDEDGDRIYRDETLIRYNAYETDEDGVVTAKHQATLDALEKFVNGTPVPGDPLNTEVDIEIIMGDDYQVF